MRYALRLGALAAVFCLAGCLGAVDGGLCSPADRADPTSRCYCLDINRDQIRGYDDNAPPAWEVAEESSPAGGSLYDGSTVEPSRGGATGTGPSLVPR